MDSIYGIEYNWFTLENFHFIIHTNKSSIERETEVVHLRFARSTNGDEVFFIPSAILFGNGSDAMH